MSLVGCAYRQGSRQAAVGHLGRRPTPPAFSLSILRLVIIVTRQRPPCTAGACRMPTVAFCFASPAEITRNNLWSGPCAWPAPSSRQGIRSFPLRGLLLRSWSDRRQRGSGHHARHSIRHQGGNVRELIVPEQRAPQTIVTLKEPTTRGRARRFTGVSVKTMSMPMTADVVDTV